MAITDRFHTLRHRHAISFQNAWHGIKFAISSQPNLKIHFFLAALAVFLGWRLQISTTEWLVIVLTIFIVLTTEMINTAMEQTVDLITKEWQENAKFAKDVTSGAVLIAAIGSVIIGLIIFLPRLILIINEIF